MQRSFSIARSLTFPRNVLFWRNCIFNARVVNHDRLNKLLWSNARRWSRQCPTLGYSHKIVRHDSGVTFPANKDLHSIDKLAKFLFSLTCWPSWEVNLEEYWDRQIIFSHRSLERKKKQISRGTDNWFNYRPPMWYRDLSIWTDLRFVSAGKTRRGNCFQILEIPRLNDDSRLKQ